MPADAAQCTQRLENIPAVHSQPSAGMLLVGMISSITSGMAMGISQLPTRARPGCTHLLLPVRALGVRHVDGDVQRQRVRLLVDRDIAQVLPVRHVPVQT